jgi:hypothetical protein
MKLVPEFNFQESVQRTTFWQVVDLELLTPGWASTLNIVTLKKSGVDLTFHVHILGYSL